MERSRRSSDVSQLGRRSGIPQWTQKLDDHSVGWDPIRSAHCHHFRQMPHDPDPAEVAAELRRVLDAVDSGALEVSNARDREFIYFLVGAETALRKVASRRSKGPRRNSTVYKGPLIDYN